MSIEVDLVDIGGGNIGSVSRCLHRLGVKFHQVDGQRPPDGSRPLIVPGVGAFGAVMESLSRSGLDGVLRKLVAGGTPYLGICVGMQVLFDKSAESPGAAGLGLVQGKVVRHQHEKVPQIGWNKIVSRHEKWQPGYAYFVNSFYPVPQRDDVVLYEAEYGGRFCAAVSQDNITAFQFHPEKSGEFGEQLLRRWLANVG
jgi:imidazole glycerol phosphate synthase glutamine amidotransferase subunit